MTQALVFAHVSDPHLTTPALPGRRDLLTKRLTGYLAWRRRWDPSRDRILAALLRDLGQQKPDHVIVTGDLTNLGTADEHRQAAAWLGSIGDAADVSAVPGNHDCYVPEPWASTLARWAAHARSDGACPRGDEAFPFIRVRGPVAFIGLSSACPTAPGLATGRLGRRQLDEAARLLRFAGDRGYFRVVLIHHPPTAGTVSWRKRLIDGPDLCAAIRHPGAELVLHGHAHRFARDAIPGPGGPVPVLGVPAVGARASDGARTAAYHCFRVRPARDGWQLDVRVRCLERATEEFGEASPGDARALGGVLQVRRERAGFA